MGTVPTFNLHLVGTVPTFNLHLVWTLKNHFYQTDLLLLVHPVCVPKVPMAIQSVSCLAGYSSVGLIKTDKFVTYYECNELKVQSYFNEDVLSEVYAETSSY